MTTRRSLTKLERRAHMSIHNAMEVVEEEAFKASHFTRDRFGKRQQLNGKDENL